MRNQAHATVYPQQHQSRFTAMMCLLLCITLNIQWLAATGGANIVSTTHLGSQVQAGGSLSMVAGTASNAGDINVTGSTVHAAGNASIRATGDIAVVNAYNTQSYEQETSTRRR